MILLLFFIFSILWSLSFKQFLKLFDGRFLPCVNRSYIILRKWLLAFYSHVFHQMKWVILLWVKSILEWVVILTLASSSNICHHAGFKVLEAEGTNWVEVWEKLFGVWELTRLFAARLRMLPLVVAVKQDPPLFPRGKIEPPWHVPWISYPRIPHWRCTKTMPSWLLREGCLAVL